MKAPDCYKCTHRHSLLPESCHSACTNTGALATGHEYGIRGGWFHWPFNFDPIWVKTCDGFKRESKT